ncbi:hypothetical protein MUN78_10070 [Leucobacter allii]|uniref:Uncharacterized protein n=1 Tax=Leucobacter allii TaxID=2932247 RepID=A0ABY4FH95_9MICO|nr:hypothetical protein [Leucobacter allii]UOQ56049.1 hypothetical protein MUN78_10070 [Leucobacter allii]
MPDRVGDTSVVWAVARAFGSEDEAIARIVEDAEDQRLDEEIRRRESRKAMRDLMQPSWR